MNMHANRLPSATASERRAGRSRLSMLTERAVEALVHLCGLSAILFIVAIFGFIAKEGLVTLIVNLPQMLSSTDWGPTDPTPSWGILALLAGTAWCVGLSLVLSVPLGLAAAIYLSEFAPSTLRETVK